MTRTIERYRNIPIGTIIKKDLKQHDLSQKDFARIIGMPYHKLNEALNGHQLFSIEEGDRIDAFFRYEKSFVVSIQISGRRSSPGGPISCMDIPIPAVRPCVFWDTDLHKLDWIRHRKFVTERVAVYGNEDEREAVCAYYQHLIARQE